MRTTVTINDKLYTALKHRSIESDTSVSSIIENSIKYQLLEDMEDIEDAKKRQDEPQYSFNDLIKEFKKEGLL